MDGAGGIIGEPRHERRSSALRRGDLMAQAAQQLRVFVSHAYDRALAIDPHFAAAWNNKGACLRMLERPIEAAAMEQHARELGWQV